MTDAIDRDKVREALESLYDDVGLARARIGLLLPGVQEAMTIEERARMIRALLLEALELLRPQRRWDAATTRRKGSGRPGFGSAESRPYDVLTLRYLERLSIADLEEELSLGRRQVYRALEEAEARLADILSSRAQVSSAEQAGSSRGDFLAEELAAAVAHPGHVELQKLLAEAAELVAPLAQERHVTVSLASDGKAGLVLADRAMLRQVLVQLLACSVQSGGSQVTAVCRGWDEREGASVTISFTGDIAAVERRLADAQRIAGSRGMACELKIAQAAQECEVTLNLRTDKPVSVLVVEDNPGAVELYRRYLSAGGWQLHHTTDPRAAVSIAAETKPDIIVLDIMMPYLDGWSVLHSLRNNQATASIPILICSVVEQPELGTALGATVYLTKPVSQAQFLSALRACLG